MDNLTTANIISIIIAFVLSSGLVGTFCYFLGIMNSNNKIYETNEQLHRDYHTLTTTYNDLAKSFEWLEKDYQKKYIELDALKARHNKFSTTLEITGTEKEVVSENYRG